MQIKPIIYDSLTPRQRVIATIEAEARGDKEEVQRLVKSCPKKLYRENDAAYTQTMHNLMYVSLGVECEMYKNAISYIAALYLDYGVMEKFLQNIIDIRTAWHETLDSMGITLEAMNKASPLKPSFVELIEELLPEPEPENVAKIAADMRRCFALQV